MPKGSTKFDSTFLGCGSLQGEDMNDSFKFKLPGYVSECIGKIEGAGFQAWVVGGSIRDLLLGLCPLDYDIATDALPHQIMSIFPSTLPIGIKHGTVSVRVSENYLEVTTFRSEGKYFDNRRPSEVEFLSEIEDDLARRDFTINAMAYSPTRGFKDPFFGEKDLEKGIVRTVGDPQERFGEDALRILRAFRFASVLNFGIDEDTSKAALDMGSTLANISVERIRDELVKLLGGAKPSVIGPLVETGALAFLGIKGGTDLRVLDKVENEPYTRLAVLLFLCGGEKVAMRKLKLSNKNAREVAGILDVLMGSLPKSKFDTKKRLQSKSLYTLESGVNARSVLLGEDVSEPLWWIKEIVENKEPYKISMLNVKGGDLLARGLSGKDVGRALEKLLDLVLERPELNNKEDLLRLLEELEM